MKNSRGLPVSPAHTAARALVTQYTNELIAILDEREIMGWTDELLAKYKELLKKYDLLPEPRCLKPHCLKPRCLSLAVTTSPRKEANNKR